MRILKQNLLYFIIGAILFTITIVIVYLSLNQAPTTNTPSVVSPTPSNSDISPQASPSPAFEQEGNVVYDIEASKKMWETFYKKPALSADDEAAKRNLLFSILRGIESGVVYESSNVRVEYIKTADIFQATILTANIDKAKEETEVFFLNNGLTTKALCDIPLMFGLDPFVEDLIQGSPIIFDPLPAGCEE